VQLLVLKLQSSDRRGPLLGALLGDELYFELLELATEGIDRF